MGERRTDPRLRRVGLFLGLTVVVGLVGWWFAPPAGLNLRVEDPSDPDRNWKLGVERPPFAVPVAEPEWSDTASLRYRGWLRLDREGTWFLTVTDGATDGATIRLDGEDYLEPRRLERGLHRIELRYPFPLEDSGKPLTFDWSREIDLPRPVPSEVVYPLSVPAWRILLRPYVTLLFWLLAGCSIGVGLHAALGRRRWRGLCFAVAAMAAAVLIAIVVGELGLRIAGVKPRDYIPADVFRSAWWTDYPGPGQTTEYVGWLPLNVKEYAVPVTFNARGWRDRDYAIRKPEGTFRVVVLGDSYVEAKEVLLEDTFHKLLESRLNEAGERPVEVIAVGRGGSGTGGQLDFLRNEGLLYDPDLVVLAVFLGNDVQENSETLFEDYLNWLRHVYKPYIIAPKLELRDRLLKVQGSYLNHFVVDQLLDIYTRYAYLFHEEVGPDDLVNDGVKLYKRGPYDDEWSAAWKFTLDRILDVRDLAESRGAAFRVMLVHSAQMPGLDPDRISRNDYPDLDLKRPTRILTEFCESNEIDYLDLEPALTEHFERTGERYYWQYDAHWNELGHRIVADELSRVLSESTVNDPPR